jgi:DNA-binding LacI/PurR family transcriptional regulator
MAPSGDLTTIAQPVRRQGELAARQLLGLLDGELDDAEADLVLPTRLVVRGTTGPPPPDGSGGNVFA